ncbi:Carboxylic acid transporter [Hyphodiscus hymeniophilus]|uniref:Carboxylic acid transporter n=1 Tax=Hyphodiscus hymeniophilus TaxID=353542 RepID=A0A9P6SKM5_9HELO|nr:Carboxylic acid transporter [Hyphodiscus hymeniophilus]
MHTNITMGWTKIPNKIESRISELKPNFKATPNPIALLRLLSRQQWLFFWVAFLAWTWDAFDFFSVTLVVPALCTTFGKSHDAVVWGGLTLPLMTRFVGAGLFGLAADRLGRKWPFVVNLVLLIVFELTTGFCTTYQSFVACRVLFGIAMGGLYGNAASTALEDCPEPSRGLVSGMFQSGYSFGFLLATVFYYALAERTSHGWRLLFWFGACPPVFIIAFRIWLPETDAYCERLALRNERRNVRTAAQEAKDAAQVHWLILVYLTLFVAGLTFITHGSQDLYPLLMSDKYFYSKSMITRVQVTANIGAMLGGMTAGYCSQILGRRFCLIVLCVLAGSLLYPYTHVSNSGLIAIAFFEQFCIQGALGIVPIHLVELAPAEYRVFVVGFSYQLGVLISSPVDGIEARIGEHFPLNPFIKNGLSTKRYDYGQVMAIFIGCAYIYTIIITAVGPENRGRRMGLDDDELDNIDFEIGERV